MPEQCCHVPTDLFSRSTGTEGLVLGLLWSNDAISAAGVIKDIFNQIIRHVTIEDVEVLDCLIGLIRKGEIVCDISTAEAVPRDWFHLNYRQPGSIAESRDVVLKAIHQIESPRIKDWLLEEVSNADSRCWN